MARGIVPGRSYNPADGSQTPSFQVERDPSHGIFDTAAEAEAWRDRLDAPDDLGPTAARASG
jgi:hypothetical protein